MFEILETLRRIERKQDAVLAALRNIATGEKTIMSTVDDLNAQIAALQGEVAQTIGVEESAITLIDGLAAQLQAAISDNGNSAQQVAAVSDVVAKFVAERQKLAAAVAAQPGTPAQPPATAPVTGADPGTGPSAGTPPGQPAP